MKEELLNILFMLVGICTLLYSQNVVAFTSGGTYSVSAGGSGLVAIPVETLPAGSYLVVMNVNGQRYYENTMIKK